jgi:hypothetical protein
MFNFKNGVRSTKKKVMHNVFFILIVFFLVVGIGLFFYLFAD